MQTGNDDRGDDSPEVRDILAVVLDALYDLNRHRDANTLSQAIVSIIARIVPCESVMFARIEPAIRSFTLSSWPPDRFASVHHTDAVRLHVQHHPLVAHFSTRRDARSWSLHDFVPRPVFQRTPLYQTLYRPVGIEFQLAMLVPFPDRAPRVVALNRSDAPFSDADRHMLELLWPHLTQVVRTLRAAGRKNGVRDPEGSSGGRAVLMLDRAGKVELCTEQARIWLTRYCTTACRGGRSGACPNRSGPGSPKRLVIKRYSCAVVAGSAESSG